MSLACPDAVCIPEPLIILIKVDDLDSEGLALLDITGVILNNRIHVFKDTVRFLVLWRVFNIQLKLREDPALFAFAKLFLEESII